jgi:hypothetical protein
MATGFGELGTSFCKTIVNNPPGWLLPLGYRSPQVFPKFQVLSLLPSSVNTVLTGLQLEGVVWEEHLPVPSTLFCGCAVSGNSNEIIFHWGCPVDVSHAHTTPGVTKIIISSPTLFFPTLISSTGTNIKVRNMPEAYQGRVHVGQNPILGTRC